MGKNERFTNEQLTLSGGIKKLIELYYLLKPHDESKWKSKGVADILTQFFKTVFGRCRYDHKSDTFYIDVGGYIKVTDQQLSYLKRNNSIPLEFDGKRMFISNSRQSLKISDIEFHSFLEIMDCLHEMTTMKEFIHFSIGGITDLIDTSITKVNKRPSDKNVPYTVFAKKTTWPVIRKQIDKTIIDAVKNQKHYTRLVSNIKIFSSSSRFVQVNTHSEFAKKILYTEPREETPTTIPSLGFQNWDSFIRIIRSVFVNYHFAFGDFKRIKLCKKCKKLLFEKKKGSRDFCSDDCKIKKFIASEPQKKIRCRNRQNEWHRRTSSGYITYNIIKKKECRYCKKYPKKIKAGYCPLVQHHNKKLN